MLCSENFQRPFVDLMDNFSFIEINYHVELLEVTIRSDRKTDVDGFTKPSHLIYCVCVLLHLYNI